MWQLRRQSEDGLVSWSLSRFPINARAEDALSSIGRAVHIAARFEEKCKFVLRLANLAEVYGQDRAVSFDELIAQVPTTSCLEQRSRTCSRPFH